MSQEPLGLFDTQPDRRQEKLGLIFVALLLLALPLIAPARNIHLGQVDAFIPMVNAILFMGELITATLLYAQASVFRSRALTVLGSGYLLASLLLIPHALTFPGAFSENGLLGAGVNTSPWLSMFRRAAFPLSALAYVLLKGDELATEHVSERRTGIGTGVLAALLLAAALAALATAGKDLLPPFYQNNTEAIRARGLAYESVIFVLFATAAIALFRRRTSVLDLWLLVAFCGWLVQSMLVMTLTTRFTAGWYWLYAVTLFAHLVVMIALIVESIRLYARLARTTAARSREREGRLMSADAVAAAMAHEAGQPLTAAITQASVSLNWLTRDKPDTEMAIRSLHASLEAGRRTADVIKSIRAMFPRKPGVAREFFLNDLVRSTASVMDRELAGDRIMLHLNLDPELPPIIADRVQMQRVLVNLFTNAIESLSATRDRQRRITVRTAPLDGHHLVLEISDNGVGVVPETRDRIFEAFFTTKSTGTGLGLALCRTIVESHGGRLWATPNEPHGATFHVQLAHAG